MKCVSEVKDNAEKHDKLINRFEKAKLTKITFSEKYLFFMVYYYHSWLVFKNENKYFPLFVKIVSV